MSWSRHLEDMFIKTNVCWELIYSRIMDSPTQGLLSPTPVPQFIEFFLYSKSRIFCNKILDNVCVCMCVCVCVCVCVPVRASLLFLFPIWFLFCRQCNIYSGKLPRFIWRSSWFGQPNPRLVYFEHETKSWWIISSLKFSKCVNLRRIMSTEVFPLRRY